MARRRNKVKKQKIEQTPLENYNEITRNRTKRVDLIYLNVPFAEKDSVKFLGARWDELRRKWFINSDFQNPNAFQPWLPVMI
jgi:predicted aconitase